MSHNINAGRMRHFIEVFDTDEDDEDDNGERVEGTIKLFEARANVKTVKGVQSSENGAVVNATIITCLMWYDVRMVEDLFIKWNDDLYRVGHISPDDENKSMIVTCEVIK